MARTLTCSGYSSGNTVYSRTTLSFVAKYSPGTSYDGYSASLGYEVWMNDSFYTSGTVGRNSVDDDDSEVTVTHSFSLANASTFPSGCEISLFGIIKNYSGNEYYTNTIVLKLSVTPTKLSWASGSLKVNSSASDVGTTASTATLSWPKASNGTENSFSAYNVQYRSRSSSSASWGSYSNYGSNITNVNTLSLSVSSPSAVGAQYQFTIQAQGSAGSSYYSDKLTSPVLTKTCTAITWSSGSLQINSSSSDVGSTAATATLSWPKANNGTNNAFSAYNIKYRSRSSSSAAWGSYANYGSNITNVNTTSLSVNTPASVGGQYQFTIQALGSAGGSGYYSTTLTSPVITRTCTAITWGTGSAAVSDQNPSGTTIILSWPQASSGSNNAFTSYKIQYKSRNDSSATWGAWTDYPNGTISTIGTTSATVNTPASHGAQYTYRVCANGTVSGYDATPLEAPVVTRTGTKITWNSGSSCTLSATTSTGGSVILSWPAAVDGTLNAVSNYVIQRKEYSDSWGSYANLTTTTGTSLSVDPPATLGKQYKYRVQAIGPLGGNYDSDWLETADSLSPQATACIEPQSVALNASTVDVGSTVILSWSGAAGGAYNPITGYHIYKSTDGITYSKITEVSSTSANGSVSGLAVGNAGETVYFKVYTIGTVSGMNSGASAAASVTAQAVVYPTVFRNVVVRKNNQNVKSSICVRAGTSWIPINVCKYDAANDKWVYCGKWHTL